jgi:hypothetical protein
MILATEMSVKALTYWKRFWCLAIELESALFQLLTKEEVLIAINLRFPFFPFFTLDPGLL